MGSHNSVSSVRGDSHGEGVKRRRRLFHVRLALFCSIVGL